MRERDLRPEGAGWRGCPVSESVPQSCHGKPCAWADIPGEAPRAGSSPSESLRFFLPGLVWRPAWLYCRGHYSPAEVGLEVGFILGRMDPFLFMFVESLDTEALIWKNKQYKYNDKCRESLVFSSCPSTSESSQSQKSRCLHVRWSESPDKKSLDKTSRTFLPVR